MNANRRKSASIRRRSTASPLAAAAAASLAAAGPPMLVQMPRVVDTLRFQASSALSAVDITWSCLRNLYFSTSTATAANAMPAAIRLAAIEVWAPPSGSSSSSTFAQPLTLRYREGNGLVGEDKTVSEVVTSTNGCYIHRKFSKSKTDTGKWHLCAEISTSDIAFTLVAAPAGTVIDVHYGWVGFASGTSVSALTCVGLTAGRYYRNSLDNTALGGGVGGALCLPIGVSGSTATAWTP